MYTVKGHKAVKRSAVLFRHKGSKIEFNCRSEGRRCWRQKGLTANIGLIRGEMVPGIVAFHEERNDGEVSAPVLEEFSWTFKDKWL